MIFWGHISVRLLTGNWGFLFFAAFFVNYFLNFPIATCITLYFLCTYTSVRNTFATVWLSEGDWNVTIIQ